MASPRLTRRQAAVLDLIPERGDGYIREEWLKRRLAGLTATEIRRTLDQLAAKGLAKGFAGGFGWEWRQTDKAERLEVAHGG